MTYRRDSSFPVENGYGTQVEPIQSHKAQRKEGQVKEKNLNKSREEQNKRIAQVLGYVPMQIANLSLEEIKIGKHVEVGVASPIQSNDAQVCEQLIVYSK
jgi:hypothetical protein